MSKNFNEGSTVSLSKWEKNAPWRPFTINFAEVLS